MYCLITPSCVFQPLAERLAAITANLAAVLQAGGQLDQSEVLMRAALEADEALHGSHHPHVAAACSNLAELLATRGQ